jgi:hypothetical protein
VLLQRLRKARASEYAAGVAPLPPKLRSDLLKVLRRALQILPLESQALGDTNAAIGAHRATGST